MPFKFNPLTGSIDSVNSRSEDATYAGDITVSNTKPTITLNDTNNESDFWIQNDDGVFAIKDLDTSGGIGRLTIAPNGVTTFSGNCDFSNGIDVTGAATFAGDISLSNTTQNNYFGLTADSTAINFTLGSTSGTNPRMYFYGTGNGDASTSGNIFIGTGTGGIVHIRSAESMKFEVNSDSSTAEALSITAAGNVSITDGNLVVGNGHGINFVNYGSEESPDNAATDVTSNLFNDYEEGTWIATCANSVTLHDGDNLCSYTKIGRQVTVNGQVRVNSDNSNAVFKITSLPFNSADLAEGAARCVGSVRLNGIDVTNSTEFIGVNCNNSDGSDDLFFTLNQDNAGTADLLAKADGYVMFTLTYFSA